MYIVQVINMRELCPYKEECNLFRNWCHMCNYPTDLEENAHEFRLDSCKIYEIKFMQEFYKGDDDDE